MFFTSTNIQGLPSNNFHTLPPPVNGLQKWIHTPNTKLIQKEPFIDILKNFAQFKGKQLCRNHFLIKLQVSRPETSLKRDSCKAFFLWILQNFSKSLIYRKHLWITASVDSSFPTKVLFIDHIFFVFPLFFPFIIDYCNYGSLFRNNYNNFTII